MVLDTYEVFQTPLMILTTSCTRIFMVFIKRVYFIENELWNLWAIVWIFLMDPCDLDMQEHFVVYTILFMHDNLYFNLFVF